MVAINVLVIASLLLGIEAKTGWTKAETYDRLAYKACTTLAGKTATYVLKKDKTGVLYCDLNNQPALGSVTHCIRQLPGNKEKAEQIFIDFCQKEGKGKKKLTQESFDAAYKNATEYMVVKPKKNDPNYNPKVIYDKPVKFTEKEVLVAYNAVTSLAINKNYGVWYGIALMCYWFFLIFASGVCRAVNFICPSIVNMFTGSLVNTIRSCVFLPALGKVDHIHHKTAFKWITWSLPTRWEAIMVAGWFIVALIFNAVGFQSDPAHLSYDTTSAEIGRKIADRSGIMVMFLIPQLILFAGRNNFLQWLSGWSYSRFVFIHKWIAKGAVLLVMVHAIGMCYSGGGWHGEKFLSRNRQNYVIWGYAAMIVGFIMFVQASYTVKKLNYEVFLIVHIILAAIFVAGGWIHTEDQGYEEWMYAAAAVWIFDRCVRFGRLAYFGAPKATVQLIANETIKVTVRRPKYWKSFPGCHAFIHFVRPTCFWQSHPFTIVDEKNEDGSNTISMYLKVKGGATHGLYKHLANQPNNKATIRVLIEGPYGQRLPLHRYDTAVFLTGGNGIPGLYYEARDLVKDNRNKTRVKLYWVIRNYKSIEWFYTELLKLKGTAIEPVIYVTQPHVGLITPIGSNRSSGDSSGFDEKDSAKEVVVGVDDKETDDYTSMLRNRLSFIEFREGRPNIEELVKVEISDSTGSLAFSTCAHGQMVDDSRRAVAKNLYLTKNRVDLFEEAQNW